MLSRGLASADEVPGSRVAGGDWHRGGVGFHARVVLPTGPDPNEAAGPAAARRADVASASSAKRERSVRSVSTSEVASTSAPLTTWAVLTSGWRPVQITKAPSVTWTRTSRSRIAAGRVSSRRPPW